MKPIKLEIEGLNSFETKQTLDFAKLGSGVFGIFGKTGSGKSTILDAITLALYGKVERTKQNIDFVNTKSNKAVVSLEFEIFTSGETRKFLVTRSFSRKKNGKDLEASAALYEYENGDKKLIEEGSVKVGDKIFSIIGLGVHEFAKCIALPQGEFSAFLQAKPAERTELMSNIFDLSKYGEKLVSSVKEKINQFDKEVSVLKASKEMVCYATDELVEQTKQGFDQTKETYDKTSLELGEKSKLFTKSKMDFDKNEKLKEIVKELSELEIKVQDFKKIENEIQKGQSANAIRGDYEKLQKCTTDEKALSQKISELNEIKLQKASDLQEAENDLAAFQQLYETKIVELNAKLGQLKDLQKFEADIKEYEAEKLKTIEEIASKRKDLAAEQENNAYYVSVLTNIQAEITKIDEFIDKNKPDVELSYALEQTKGVESELILIDDQYKRLEELIDHTEQELKNVQEEYNSAIKKEREYQAKREKITNSIEVAFEDVDNTDFKKIRSLDKELDGMREVDLLVNKVDEQIAKLLNENDSRRTIIQNIAHQIEIETKKLNELENTISSKEKDVESFRESRDELFGENVISMISNHLKIGDHCPVCENRVIQKQQNKINDLGQIEGEISKVNNNITSLRFERDKMLANIISLKSRYEFERIQIEENEHEVKVLSEGKNTLYQRFVDNNEESAENFKKLYNLLQTTSDSLEELIELQDVIREEELNVTIQKAQAGTKVSVYKSYLESLIDILYDLQKKKAEREFVIYNVQEKFSSLKEYKKQIAEGKNIEIEIENQKDRRVSFRDEQMRVTQDKLQSDLKIAQIRSDLTILEERVSNLESQISSATSRILASGVPEGVSVDQEKEETDKVIENMKSDLTNKQTRVDSCKTNVNRTETDYNVNSSILESKRNEIQELQQKVSKHMTDNEFESIQELENCFVDPGEIKAKQEKVNEFNDRMRILSAQKQELESEELSVMDKQELDELEKNIQELNESVKLLSESLGKAGADLDRIVEANEKLNHIVKDLAIAEKNYDTAKELGTVLRGKALAEFVCEEYLQEITVSANQKLAVLMDGRYTLRFENKEFYVEDNFNDGKVRPASTLSGGETFVVSLSLALSISDAITMLSSRSMDFFFLDEGFGTLDSELCSIVVSSLYKLESQNLSIGLISHVAELEESIKNKVLVTKDANGSHIEIVHSL